MNSLTASIQDMGIDYRGTDSAVPQELLNGSDVVAVFQQMCGERMTQRVAAGRSELFLGFYFSQRAEDLFRTER